MFSLMMSLLEIAILLNIINVKDSLPIKQLPRRIPFQKREEVNKIIEDMKKQGVIEESQKIFGFHLQF